MAQAITDLEALQSQMTVRPALPRPPPPAAGGTRACVAPSFAHPRRVAPQNLKDQTIAEVLESDPEMRKEIEEELKNHQWGS